MKGLAFEWIVGMFGLFIVGIFWIAFNQAYVGGISDYADDTFRINATDTEDNFIYNNYTILDTIWTYFPIFIIFLFVLYVLIQSQRRVPPFE